ncbi:hypothetical protein AWN76_017065 [Rhodothermaceae bacterium RA]|nr:hypothetical protein AWN76_017065 [Rhodothermaceae bacterium RA]
MRYAMNLTGLKRAGLLMLALLLLAAVPREAEAQLLKRLKKRATQSVENALERKAEEAVDEAVDRAVDRAVDGYIDRAMTRVFGEKAAAEGTRQNAGMRELEAAMIGLYGAGYAGGAAVEPVPFRDLQALLPDRAAGLARTDDSGETTQAYGISMSQAQATYGSGDRRIELSIIDLGSMQSIALFGYAWFMTEVNIETEEGFERTTTFEGFPAFESLKQRGGETEAAFQVIVAQRFAVAANGDGVSLDELKAAVGAVDLQRLNELRTYGLSDEAIALQEQNARAMQGTADSLRSAYGTAGAVEVADFRALKALLPERVDGLTRLDVEGQKGTALGITTSSADATYRSDDDEIRLHLMITDLGSLQGIAMMSYGWLTTQIETEDETGYERTTTYRGYPAYEEFRNEDGRTSASMQVIVAQRFVVSAEVFGAGMEVVKAALERVDLDALASL